MVLHFVENLSDKDFRFFGHLARQVAGRRPGRGHHDFDVPRELQIRDRESPIKDIATAYRGELTRWMSEDATSEGENELADGFRHLAHTLHHTHKRDREAHTGGSLSNYLKRGASTLENLGRTAGVQADILGEDFLDRVGIKRKGLNRAEKNENTRLAARLAKSTYLHPDERTEVIDGWTHDPGHGNVDYGVYHKGEETIVDFRGTDAKYAADLKNDAKIAGAEHLELGDAKQKIQSLLDNGRKVRLFGYSMGGAKALQLIKDKDLHGRLENNNVVLAPGASPMDDAKAMARTGKTQFIYNAWDPVSSALLPHATSNHHIDKTIKNPLDAHMALDHWAK